MPAKYNNTRQKLNALIGRISISFNNIEFTLRCIIHSIMINNKMASAPEDDQRVYCLIAGDGFDVLLIKVDRLIHLLKDKSLIERFGKLKEQLHRVNGNRNVYLHSMYLTIANGNILRLKFKKNIKIKHHEPEVLDIQRDLKITTLVEFAKYCENIDSQFEEFYLNDLLEAIDIQKDKR